jgi:hypothetical protein
MVVSVAGMAGTIAAILAGTQLELVCAGIGTCIAIVVLGAWCH